MDAHEMQEGQTQQSSKLKPVMFIAIVILFLSAGYYFNASELLRNALSSINNLGVFGYLLFIFLYILACICFLPGWILTLGAGAVFGLVKGTVLVSIASTLGATSAFLAGRYFARDFVAKKIEGNARFSAIDNAVADEGAKIVFLTRLSPVFPFNLLNYGFGLTKVRLGAYFLASWVGMFPGTVMYVYIGTLAGDLAALGAGERTKTPAEWALLTVGLVATITVTVFITKIARRSLEQKV